MSSIRSGWFTLAACILLACAAAHSRPLLVPEAIDPQDDFEEDVEWVTAAELQRRINAAKDHQAAAAYGSWDSGLDSIPGATSALDAAGGRSLQDEVPEPTRTPGPLYPVFEEDLPPDLTVTFAVPTVPARSDAKPTVPIKPPPGCQSSRVSTCRTGLTECLAADPLDRRRACSCFKIHADCYRGLGCFELLPKTDVEFCFYRFHCSMEQCESSGAAAVRALPPLAFAALLLAPLLAATYLLAS